MHDVLTGLLNRAGLRHFSEMLKRELVQKAGVLFIDVDDFKLVNDTHGHAAGDRILQALAQRVQRVLPDGAKAALVGGDEFIVVVAPISASALHDLVRSVTGALSRPYELHAGTTLSLTSSVGAAASHGSGESLEALFDRADRASYEIKFARKSAFASEQATTTLKQLKASFEPSGLRVLVCPS